MAGTSTPVKPHRYTSKTYELLNITPVTGYLAVWAMQREDNPSLCELEARPLHLLGVARVTSREYEQIPARRSVETGRRDTWHQAVALEAMEGEVAICNECSNFAGICREGDDISLCTAELPHEISRRLADR